MLKPLHDLVLVRRRAAESKTPGGIVLPDNAKRETEEGEVLATGPGRKTESTGYVSPVSVFLGQKVLFGKGSGCLVKVDGEELLLLREGEIFGTVS